MNLNRYTTRARIALDKASKFARSLNHDYLGLAHLLMGLALDRNSVAGTALTDYADVDEIEKAIRSIVIEGPPMEAFGKLPRAPRMDKALEYATEESIALGHSYTGPEHLLLGLLRVEDSAAMKVLDVLKVDPKSLRNFILTLLGKTQESVLAATRPIASNFGAVYVLEAILALWKEERHQVRTLYDTAGRAASTLRGMADAYGDALLGSKSLEPDDEEQMRLIASHLEEAMVPLKPKT